MGKYFKEDNQRTSSLQCVNINALVEQSIRTAQIKKMLSDLAQKVPGAYRAVEQVVKELKPGQLGYKSFNQGTIKNMAVKTDKGLSGLAKGTRLPDLVSAGLEVASYIPSPKVALWARLIKLTDKLSVIESRFPSVKEIMSRVHHIPVSVDGKTYESKKYNLKTILENTDSQNIVTFGDLKPKFDGTTTRSILADIEELNKIRNDSRFVKLLAVLGVSLTGAAIGGTALSQSANAPETVQRAQELKKQQNAPKPAEPDLTPEQARQGLRELTK